jgi:hypothetical protein
MTDTKYLALIQVESIESEDRPSTRISTAEPTVVVYSNAAGCITSVETITPKPDFGESTESVFDSFEKDSVFTGHDLVQLFLKMGFQNVELIKG